MPPNDRASRRELVVASYNVHRCCGADRVCAPERIAEVLRRLDADVVALQEVDSTLPEHGADQLAMLSRAVGAAAIAGPTLLLHRAAYGNALLLRDLPVLAVRRHDLSVAGAEPRGAIDVELDVGGAAVRVVGTHLGLKRRERATQARWLLEALDGWTGPTVLLGDCNEWLPGTSARKILDRRFGRVRLGPSFPAGRPFVSLDRIWVDPASAVIDAAVEGTATARVASDHLPVRARLDVAALVEPARALGSP